MCQHAESLFRKPLWKRPGSGARGVYSEERAIKAKTLLISDVAIEGKIAALNCRSWRLMLVDNNLKFFDSLHRQEKSVFRIREGDKAKCTVEGMGFVVFRIDDDSSGSNLLAGRERSFEGVYQQQLANSLPLERLVSRQSADQCCAGNRIARQLHLFEQFRRQIIQPDVVGSEGIEPGNAVIV